MRLESLSSMPHRVRLLFVLAGLPSGQSHCALEGSKAPQLGIQAAQGHLCVWPILSTPIGEMRQKSCGSAHRSHAEHWLHIHITGAHSQSVPVQSSQVRASKRLMTHNHELQFLPERRNKTKFKGKEKYT